MPYFPTTHNHEVYYERHGDVTKPTILFLHGGPGGGFSESDQIFFDFNDCNVIFFDQRGSGRSRFGVKNEKNNCHPEFISGSNEKIPTKNSEFLQDIHPSHHSLLNGNTTQNLINDINALLEHLEVNTKIILFGGSWGSTLSLTYAILYPQKIRSMILLGIFLPTDYRTEFLYGNGAENIFPEAYERWTSFIPPDYHGHPFDYYWQMANHDDQKIRHTFLHEIMLYEGRMCSLYPGSAIIRQNIQNNPLGSAQAALIEMFYIKYGCFLDETFAHLDCNTTHRQKNPLQHDPYLHQTNDAKSGILKYTHHIQSIPTSIVHGRYDGVCPVSDAWKLKQKLQHATLKITVAGHRSKDPENLVALQKAVKKSLAVE